MTGRSWGGRRAQAFQRALDGRVDLTEYELAEFVRLARALREMAPATLGDDTKSAMRARLVAEAETVLGPDPVPETALRRRPRRRKLRIAVGSTAAITALSTGLVSMSADALPGDLLYPIKRGVEQVELTVAGGGAADTGRTRLDHAAERLDEAEQLAQNGDADRVGEVLDDFTSDAEIGADQLLRAYAADGDPAEIEEIRGFANTSAARLRAIAPMLGASSGTAYETAVDTVISIDRQAVAACPACAGGPTVQVPYDPDHVEALPHHDRDGTTDQDDGDAAIVAQPGDLPDGAEFPPIEHPDQGGDNGDDGDVTDSDKPMLVDRTTSGSDSSDYVRPDKDPIGEALPDLPGLDEQSGSSIVGSLPLGPVDDVLAPVQDLLDQLGPIGDLLEPVIGTTDESGSEDTDQPEGPLDDLLGPVLGTRKAEADDKPRDANLLEAGLDQVQQSREYDDSPTDESTDESTNESTNDPADDLIDGIDGVTDAPPVEADELDPLDDAASDGTAAE